MFSLAVILTVILVLFVFASQHGESRRQPRFMGMIVGGWCSTSGLDCTPPNSECVADKGAPYTQQSCRCKSGFASETYPDRCIPDGSGDPAGAYCNDPSDCRYLPNSLCKVAEGNGSKCICQPGFVQEPSLALNKKFNCVRKDCSVHEANADTYCRDVEGRDFCDGSGRCACSPNKLMVKDKCIDPVSTDINCTDSIECQLIHPNLQFCFIPNGQSYGRCSCPNPSEKLHVDSGNKTWTCRGQLSGEPCSVDKDCWSGQNLKCWANAAGPGQHRCFCQPYYRQNGGFGKCQPTIGRFCGMSTIGNAIITDICGRPEDPTKGMTCTRLSPTSSSGMCLCKDGLEWSPEKSSCEPARP